jgi:F0F1-type ATP synthase membrane subunit b/b'
MIPDSWKLGVLTALALLIISVIAGLAISRANLKAELAKAQAQGTLCEGANAAFQIQMADTRKEVQAIKEDAAKRAEGDAKAIKEAAREAEKRSALAAYWQRAQPKGNACDDLTVLLRRYREKAQ